MSRVDFFLRGEDEWMINEVNTLPGFTKISMYPKLWELSGLPYGQLLDRLIQLAIERFERDNALKTQVEL
jgi:D-alanine-D-alanine ligase